MATFPSPCEKRNRIFLEASLWEPEKLIGGKLTKYWPLELLTLKLVHLEPLRFVCSSFRLPSTGSCTRCVLWVSASASKLCWGSDTAVNCECIPLGFWNSLPEEEIFEQTPEKREGTSPVKMWIRDFRKQKKQVKSFTVRMNE